MDNKIREQIRERAISLFPIIRDQLNSQYEIDHALGNCFKYLYLITYGPKRYLREFEHGSLDINPSDVQDVFFDYAEYIPGEYGLQDFERSIIDRHNFEVKKYLQKSHVVLPYKKTSMGISGYVS